MTRELAKMLQLLCYRYANKGNYINYTYNDDMQAYAMMMLCKTWNAFDPEKSSNPFAFYTQCIKHSFSQFLNSEKRQRDIRDAILVDNGLNPSFTYQMEHTGTGEGGTCVESDYHGWGADD
jgi:DNA-directed RNA polymerase specialized sigma subunit